jgi:hypothetical protein
MIPVCVRAGQETVVLDGRLGQGRSPPQVAATNKLMPSRGSAIPGAKRAEGSPPSGHNKREPGEGVISMEIRPIESEADYRETLAEIETLMPAAADTPEGERLDVLVTLVEAYEAKHFPLTT